MGKLSGAIQKSAGGSMPELKTKEAGEYRAFWIGMTDPVTEKSPFGDKCTLCKGSGSGKRGEPGECNRCDGSGDKTEQYVTLSYHLENGNVEEEKVAYKLSDSGKLKDGSPRSASKLFLRFRAFAQLPRATAEDLDVWFSALVMPPKVPVRVDLEFNASGDYLKIENVKYRAPAQGAQTAQPAARVERQLASVATGIHEGAPHGTYAGDSFEDDGSVPF
jgi:hypothetical protein